MTPEQSNVVEVLFRQRNRFSLALMRWEAIEDQCRLKLAKLSFDTAEDIAKRRELLKNMSLAASEQKRCKELAKASEIALTRLVEWDSDPVGKCPVDSGYLYHRNFKARDTRRDLRKMGVAA